MVLCSMGTGFLSPGVKQECNKADHSPLSSAKCSNEWSYTCTPLYTFMACTGTVTPYHYVYYHLTALCTSCLGPRSKGDSQQPAC